MVYIAAVCKCAWSCCFFGLLVRLFSISARVLWRKCPNLGVSECVCRQKARDNLELDLAGEIEIWNIMALCCRVCPAKLASCSVGGALKSGQVHEHTGALVSGSFSLRQWARFLRVPEQMSTDWAWCFQNAPLLFSFRAQNRTRARIAGARGVRLE